MNPHDWQRLMDAISHQQALKQVELLKEALKLIRDTPETSAGYMRTIAEAAIMKAEGRS